MQSVSSRIWTRIAVFIAYGDNDYTTGTSVSKCDRPVTMRNTDQVIVQPDGVSFQEQRVQIVWNIVGLATRPRSVGLGEEGLKAFRGRENYPK